MKRHQNESESATLSLSGDLTLGVTSRGCRTTASAGSEEVRWRGPVSVRFDRVVDDELSNTLITHCPVVSVEANSKATSGSSLSPYPQIISPSSSSWPVGWRPSRVAMAWEALCSGWMWAENLVVPRSASQSLTASEASVA